MEEQITQFLINLTPAILAAATIITAAVKIIKSFKQTSNEIRTDANLKDLVEENKELRKENRAILQAMREQNREASKLRQEIQMQRRNNRR